MKLSVLAKPFSSFARAAKDAERRFNLLKYKLRGNRYKAWTCSFTDGGHQDVLDSVIKGSVSFPGVELLLNPSRRAAAGSVVYVPSGWRALEDAIELKRSGEIQALIAGPTVCDLPHMHDYIIADPAVDCCLVASEWVRELFLLETADKYPDMNIKVWAAGVDHEYWRPHESCIGKSPCRALVYVKNSGAEMLPSVASLLSEINCEFYTIYNGRHTPSDYKAALERADCEIVLGESETQGLAIAQAWSMGRPTFVYDSPVISKYHRDYYPKTALKTSCAPYLCGQTGAFWKNTDELAAMLLRPLDFSPRKWILENQTNKIAFGKFLEIAESLVGE